MAPPATKNSYVSKYTFGAIGTVIVVMGGVIVTLTWASMTTEHKDLKECDKEQINRISVVERAIDVQAEQLDNIEGSVAELKVGQREILKRLPAQ